MDYLWISSTSRDWGEADLRILIVPIILRYIVHVTLMKEGMIGCMPTQFLGLKGGLGFGRDTSHV